MTSYNEKWENLAAEKTCYSPCPPFYDFCNRRDWDSEECRECAKKYGLEDFIE